jgi:hypothetical protein
MRGILRRSLQALSTLTAPTYAGKRRCPDSQQVQPPRYSYWAFISYARSDERWARSLHKRLEAYRIPREVRPASVAAVPSVQRLRPVFRDSDELPASADLGARLRDAMDRSRYLIILASPAAAASRWVNAEAQYIVDSGRADDVLVLVVDGEPGGTPPREALPAALKQSAEEEPLWVDARKSARLDRKTVLRIIAGMLEIGFDALWRRTRRQRRRQLTVWAAVSLLLVGITGGAIWRQRTVAERDKPARQVAAFRQYLVEDILKTMHKSDPGFMPSDVTIDLVRTEDLNDDSLVDFFVFNNTTGFCGSGGCGMEVYMSKGRDQYMVVLDLFGSSTPRTRTSNSSDYKEILATHYSINAEPIYTVFRWAGENYELSHYEFCEGIWIEYCSPAKITPIDRTESERLVIAPHAKYISAPKTSAPRARNQVGAIGAVVGKISNGDWYLVELWKGESAFVSRRYVSSR